MTAFAEVIFETGAKSILSFDDVKELDSFLVEHDRRARAGEDGGPTGHPAERVSKVYVYSVHPANLNQDGAIPVEHLRELASGMAGTGTTVNGNQLIEALRDEMSPVYPVDQGRHESMYKMTGTEYDVAGALGRGGAN